MWWMAAIQIGIAAVSAIEKNRAEKKAFKNQKRIDEANTYVQNLLNETNAAAANKVRGANNKVAVAQTRLSNTLRSIGNQAKLEAGGDAIAALNTNLIRLQDRAANGSLNQGIAAAEQLGAVHAQAAAMGVGGTSSAMLHQTMQLAHARAETTQQQQNQYQTYDMLAQRAGIKHNMVMALDQGQDFAPLDYGVDTAPLVQAPFRAPPGGWFLDFLNNGGAQAIGGMFGGMAGGAGGAPASSGAARIPWAGVAAARAR